MEEGESGRHRWAGDARLVAAKTGRAGLRCPEVAMVQTADFENLQDPARLRELDGPDGVRGNL